MWVNLSLQPYYLITSKVTTCRHIKARPVYDAYYGRHHCLICHRMGGPNSRLCIIQTATTAAAKTTTTIGIGKGKHDEKGIPLASSCGSSSSSSIVVWDIRLWNAMMRDDMVLVGRGGYYYLRVFRTARCIFPTSCSVFKHHHFLWQRCKGRHRQGLGYYHFLLLWYQPFGKDLRVFKPCQARMEV